MKLCIPVTGDRGLESVVSPHFGSAPGFAFVDSETGELEFVPNRNREHVHGACRPLAALAGRAVDAVVVGGIGGGALAALQSAGIAVLRAGPGTVREAMEALRSGALPVVPPGAACSGHGHAHGPVAIGGPHRHGR